MSLFRPKKIDLTQAGLAKFFGALEAKILHSVWDHNEASARQICDEVGAEQEISFNAVNTVIGRLVDKKILKKRKAVDGLWHYSAVYSRDKLYRLLSFDVMKALVRDKELFGLAAFAAVAKELSASERQELKKILKS